MRIVFFGTADFAVPALEAASPDVTLVVSQPDRPKGRGMTQQPSPVKAKALELGKRVETPEKCRSPEFLEVLAAEKADVFLVAAYGQILSQAVLDIPKIGCFNLHGSILPRWRGAAPIQRAIEAGDTQTGVTLMQMDKGLDTGDIVAIAPAVIGPDATAGEVFAELAQLAGLMTAEWMPRILSGDFCCTPQDDALATHAPKVEKAEAEITADLGLATAYNRFRAFTPVPGAFATTEFGVVKIHRARAVPGEFGQPGLTTIADGRILVSLAGGALDILELQAEGRKRMDAAEFLNGARLASGTRFLR